MQRDHLDRPRSRSRGSRAAARSRRRATPGAARSNGTRPARDLARGAPHRQRALGARPQASSSAGAQPAIVAADGESRRPSAAAARARAIMRRWIAVARGMSISCSVIDHISVSHGSGLRRTRSHGRGADRAADHRVVAEARVERPQVVVDPGREAHPRDALTRRGLGRARAAKTVPDDRDHDRLAADVQQPDEPVPAPPRHPSSEPARAGTAPSAARRPRGRGRSRARARRAQSRRSRWTSTRNELDDTISPNGPTACASSAPSWCGGARRPRPSRRRRRSRWRPARRPGRRAPTARLAPLLQHAGLGRDDGQAVDDLAVLRLLLLRQHPRTTDPTVPRRTCMVPNTRSQYGALIPKPRSSSWK